jgi:hypothetical protein
MRHEVGLKIPAIYLLLITEGDKNPSMDKLVLWIEFSLNVTA